MGDLLGQMAKTALERNASATAQVRPTTEAKGEPGLNNEDTLPQNSLRKDNAPSGVKETVPEKQQPLQGASSSTARDNHLHSNPIQENSKLQLQNPGGDHLPSMPFLTEPLGDVPNSSLPKEAQNDKTECSNRETSDPSAIVPKAVSSSDKKQSNCIDSNASTVRASPTKIRYLLEGESSVLMTVSDGKIEFSLLLLRSLETSSYLILLATPPDRYSRQDSPENERICEARICDRPLIPGLVSWTHL